MSTVNFTIIIPHYNIPQLLIRCINSIPIRPDIQVIVVDDCSKDAGSYSERYPEINRPYLEWYSTPKGGSGGRARNIGLEHAKGKWTICIDADDLFVNNMEEILDEVLKHEEDIIFFNYHTVFSNNLQKKANRDYYQQFFKQYKIDHSDISFRYNFEVIWCKVIKRDLIEKYHIRCDETKYANDLGLSIKIGYYANSIAVIDKPLFIITQRDDSISSSFFYGKRMDEEECKTRTYVAMKCQDFLDRNKANIEIITFKTFKATLLRDYPSAFFASIIKYVFVFPHASYRLFKYWFSWKIKAVKSVFNK